MEEKSGLPKYIFNWKGAVALIGGGFLFILILSFLNVVSMQIFNTNFQYTLFFKTFVNILLLCGGVWAFDYFVCRPETGKKLNFNFSTVNFSTYLLIFPMMFGMMLIAEPLVSLVPVKGDFLEKLYASYFRFLSDLMNDVSLMILMSVILAPIFEEIVFRGIIQKGLINGGMKPMKAIWISSIVFGLVHGNPWQFVGAVLLGFVLGTVYYKTKSLLLPMLLHGFNNLVSTLLIKYTDSESFSMAFNVPEWVIFSAGILIFGIFYFLFMKKYKVHYSEN